MRSFTKVSLLPALVAGAVLASPAFADQEAQKPVSFALKGGVTFTDNRDSIEDGALRAGVPMKKEDQWSFFIAPVIAFHHEVTDSVKFDASYSPVYRWYDNCRPGSEKSKLEHAVKADLDLMLSPITELKVSETFWFSGQKDYFYGTDYSYDPSRPNRLGNDYYENRFRASLKQSLSEGGDYAKATFRWRIKRYDDDELADSSDEDEFGGRLDLMRVHSKHLTYGLFADYTSWDRCTDASQYQDMKLELGVDYFTLGAQATWDFYGNGDTYLYGSFGWTHAEYEADDMDDQDCPSAQLEMRLFQTKPTQVLAGVRYGRDFSDIYPFSSQLDLAGYVALTQYVGPDRDLWFNASLELRNRQYDVEDDLDPTAYRYGYVEALKAANNGKTEYDRDSVYLRLAANYKFTDWLSGAAFYSYEKVDTDKMVGTKFDENVFGVSATLKY